MGKRFWLLLIVTLMARSAAAQDASSVLQAAASAMGVTNMKSIQYSGTGWQGAVGQNFAPDQDWPRFDLKSYTRTIDFDTMSSKEEMVRVQGSNPARGGGGAPIQGEQQIINLVSGSYAWDMQGNTVTWGSSGKAGFQGSKKSTPFAATVAAEQAAREAMNLGVRRVHVRIQGPGSGRESAIQALATAGLQIRSIRDVTPIPHNGCRPPKKRRV